jgi:ABC-type nickel/cobalt efflux system permease component RcnA
MSPAVKYTLARVGMFVVIALALTPLRIDLFLRLIIALMITAVAAFFLLRKWRDEMAANITTSMASRKAEKARLRSALAGDDESS